MMLIALAAFAGLCIGVMFFAGLWWTVKNATTSKQPGILFAASFLLRTAVCLGGFYIVGKGSWPRFVLCLVGFIAGRILVNRYIHGDHVLIQAEPVDGGVR